MSRNQVQQLIDSHPRHFSKMIQSSPVLREWVISNTSLDSDNFSEKVYSAISGETGVCDKGNRKKFLSITRGFGFCGTTGNCECARTAVSVKVSESMRSRSELEISAGNEKRKKTNLEKYGVENVGASELAREGQREFYLNRGMVDKVVARTKKTKQEKYGNENYNNSDKARETNLQRYGVENPLNLPSSREIRDRAFAERVETGEFARNGYEKFSDYVSKTYGFTLLTPFSDYRGIHQRDAAEYSFKCNACNTVIAKKFYHSVGMSCDVCNPRTPQFVSREEQEIFDFIQTELGVSGQQGDRSIIFPYELDMVFEEHRIAVEYCGLYWHSEISSGKGKDYHMNKLNAAAARGYRLITIFSDEWTNKPAIVKARLAHIFKRTAQRRYARKLSVGEVSATHSREFLNQYHIQGNAQAPIRYGLYDGDLLVALMTFSRPRKALNSNGGEGFELVRFVTDGSSVIGGASKLLNHFIRHHNPTKISTYADQRWSDGNLYRALGFTEIGVTGAGYWYVENYSRRNHRFNFTKQSLVAKGNDSSKTEWQIMAELGYDRIWDCGNLKFVMELRKPEV